MTPPPTTAGLLIGRPPSRSVDVQRQAALAVGNRIRVERSQLLEQLRAGKLDPAALLRDPPQALRTMETADLLTDVPFVGRSKVRRLNIKAALQEPLPVNLLRPVGDLTVRQQEWLIAQLPGLQRSKQHV